MQIFLFCCRTFQKVSPRLLHEKCKGNSQFHGTLIAISILAWTTVTMIYKNQVSIRSSLISMRQSSRFLYLALIRRCSASQVLIGGSTNDAFFQSARKIPGRICRAEVVFGQQMELDSIFRITSSIASGTTSLDSAHLK